MNDWFGLHRWTDNMPLPALICMLRNIGSIAGRGKHSRSMQGLVSHAFGIGGTHAAELCRRAGLDPDKSVKDALKANEHAQPART